MCAISLFLVASTLQELTNENWCQYLGPQVGIGLGGNLYPEHPILPSARMNEWLKATLNRRTSDLSIEVKVVDGVDVDLRNHAVTTLVEGKLKSLDTFQFDPRKRYLVGVVELPTSNKRRIAVLDVVIEDGPLAGAVVHFRDGTFPKSTSIACAYEVPKDTPTVSAKTGIRVFRYIGK